MGRRPEGKAENLLKNLGKKLDQIVEDLKGVADDPRYKDRVEELKRNGEKLKDEFDEFKEKHKDVFEDVEESFERAGREIKKAFDGTFKK